MYINWTLVENNIHSFIYPPIRARDNDPFDTHGLTLGVNIPVVRIDHVRVSGFFPFVNLEYMFTVSATCDYFVTTMWH
jgi:hypothetical protein